MSYIEFEYDTDEETELEELRQLKAALDDNDAGPSRGASQFSVNTKLSTSETIEDGFSDIKTAIALNKLYDQKLQAFEKMLHNRLRECRKRLEEVQGMVTIEKPTVAPFHYITCGKPYFKDRNGFAAPENEDTLLRKEAGMYDYSAIQSVTGWTLRDKSNFTKLILKISRDLKQEELKSKLAELKRQNKLQNKDVCNQISKLKREISQVSKKSLKELALPLDQEYDWYSIANKLNLRHKPQEYRALWRLFLHPNINKSAWSKKEHNKLQEIGSKTGFQGWETIAQELGTGRSSYQCFVYFRTSMVNPHASRKWTREEEEYLKRLIDYYKIGNYIPWTKVVSSMENRTRIQVYNKYLRLTEERKGRFLPEEDAIILTFADKYGPDFKRMKWYLPGRSLSQCRVRYNVLTKKRMTTVWTIEEDKKLIQLAANEDTPRNFSKIAKHFPDKDRVNIRARYMTLEKWMLRHPNIDIEHAPRRASRQIKRGNKTDNLNKAIENLKQRMESELDVKKDEVVTQQSSEEKIEDAIISLLVKEQIKIEEQEKYKPLRTPTEINESSVKENESSQGKESDVNVKHLRQLLILLRAKLNKEKFMNSYVGQKYHQLLEDDKEVFVSKTKSYSKKAMATTVTEHDNDYPDIWGKKCLGPSQYVLPPTFATIIGCRKLMNYVTDSLENCGVRYLTKCINHNRILRDEMQLLLARFYTLFLWPMLLSNHMPPEVTPVIYSESETHVERKPFPKEYPMVFQMEDYSLAIPIEGKDSKMINEVIDLPDDNNETKVDISENFNYFGV